MGVGEGNLSFNGSRPCSICGRTLENTPFPNKSAVCRYCRKKIEILHPDRHWDGKKKVWLKNEAIFSTLP